MTRRMQYDYAAALALASEEPGLNGCLGCFRCKAGDHGTCHGCVCACGDGWQTAYYGPAFVSPCPTTCRDWWHPAESAGGTRETATK